jgi:hypothetical protein
MVKSQAKFATLCLRSSWSRHVGRVFPRLSQFSSPADTALEIIFAGDGNALKVRAKFEDAANRVLQAQADTGAPSRSQRELTAMPMRRFWNDVRRPF